MARKEKDLATQPDLSIVIPVYNEAKTIKKILSKVLSLPIKNYEVVVVDDASDDDSLKIVESIKANHDTSKCGITIVKHAENRGKGAAIKSSLKYAKGKYFVVQDADLEYDPNDIVRLLNVALKNDHEVVYGSRFKGTIKNMAKPNYYANKFYNFLVRRLYDTSITDMHTCFKMVKTNLMIEFNMQSEGFDYATELISKILKKGINIVEEPISFDGRTKKEGKKINYRDGIDCTYQIFKYKFSTTT
jgi:glycosyltransferase involved in cell wall biosynthesis